MPKKKPVEPLRIDIGCGKNKKQGFVGVDQYKMDGVDVVIDLTKKKWPWKNDSVDEVHCSHFIEHLAAGDRIRFMNELYRVMKKDAKATLIAPHWCSNRAYGDLTHQWPPVAEMWFYYLSKEWRESQAPHTDAKWNKGGYCCDFSATWGYGMHPDIHQRNQEFQMDALTWKKEAATDIIATLVKK